MQAMCAEFLSNIQKTYVSHQSSIQEQSSLLVERVNQAKNADAMQHNFRILLQPVLKGEGGGGETTKAV